MEVVRAQSKSPAAAFHASSPPVSRMSIESTDRCCQPPVDLLADPRRRRRLGGREQDEVLRARQRALDCGPQRRVGREAALIEEDGNRARLVPGLRELVQRQPQRRGERRVGRVAVGDERVIAVPGMRGRVGRLPNMVVYCLNSNRASRRSIAPAARRGLLDRAMLRFATALEAPEGMVGRRRDKSPLPLTGPLDRASCFVPAAV